MTPYYVAPGVTVYHGDALDVLATLEAQSFDGVLCDPPYGLNQVNTDRTIACLTAWLAGEPYKPTGGGFMNRAWDAWSPGPELWSLVNATLKPGAHCLAFGGTRMSDFLSIALRLGGFEIRDDVAYLHDGNPLVSPLLWCFGSGFPKALSVGKSIDKAFGKEREVVGDNPNRKGRSYHGNLHEGYQRPWQDDKEAGAHFVTAPATPEAELWKHHYTALKPAHENIIVAMKPIEQTFAHNAITYGVAGLNVDGCRVGTEPRPVMVRTETVVAASSMSGTSTGATSSGEITTKGRWPANLILSGEAEAEAGFPTTGPSKAAARGGTNPNPMDWGNARADGEIVKGHDDNGGSASRFFQHCPPDADAGDAEIVRRYFYTAKSSKSERDAGLESENDREKFTATCYSESPFCEDCGKTYNGTNDHSCCSGKVSSRQTKTSGIVKNHHPTVKPLALTEYLARLILPPPRDTPRRLLVPFAGSMSEVIGALRAGWEEVVAIELDADYCAIGVARLQYWQAVIAEERATPTQAGLF